MSKFPQAWTHQLRRESWLPLNEESYHNGLKNIVDEVHRNGAKPPLLPVMKELRDFIETDGTMYMGFHQMFEQLREEIPGIEDYNTLLDVLNALIQRAPLYDDPASSIYFIIYPLMNTQAGFTTFLSSRLNAMIKKMLDTWAAFLSSDQSVYVLNTLPHGWLSEESQRAMTADYGYLPFSEVFICNPDADYYDFKSFDDFFTRALQPGIRPLELPGNSDIVSGACESLLYKYATDVKDVDKFWIKDEPYSLMHMLNYDTDYSDQFKGGIVYQGSLYQHQYHRWHSPVTGTIRKIVTVPGTYYVQSPALIGDEGQPFVNSFAFVTALTTRQLFFIESDNASIGLMCFIAIGLVEISSCEATVEEGQRVNRGDQLGMFHYGGSSHALVFRHGTKIRFCDEYVEPGQLIKVRAAIAVVSN